MLDNRDDGERLVGERFEGERIVGERFEGEERPGERDEGERKPGERMEGERMEGERVAGEREEGDSDTSSSEIYKNVFGFLIFIYFMELFKGNRYNSLIAQKVGFPFKINSLNLNFNVFN